MEISKLTIEQYSGDSGYYLFYLSKDGDEISDTYHDTLEDTFAQAEFEFGITPDCWVRSTSPPREGY